MTEYQPGDIVNGHVWTGSEWLPVRSGPPQQPAYATPVPSQVQHQSPYQRPTGMRTNTKIGIGIGVAAAIGAALIFVLGGGSKSPSSGSSSSTVFGGGSVTKTVTYEVEGSARAVDITMQTATGTSQQSDLSLPLTSKSGGRGLQVTMQSGDFVYISAQNKGETGTVTCRITVNGITVSENTSSGAYQIAQCNGSVP